MRLLAVALAAALLAGCAAPAADSEPDAGAPPREPGARPPLGVPSFRVSDLGLLTSNGPYFSRAEPSVAAAPDGTLYVLASGHLWRSADGGASWEALGESYCTFQTPACPGLEARDLGLPHGWDGDLVADAAGRLHYLGLGCAGQSCVPHHTSDDRGESWSDGHDLAQDMPKDQTFNFDRQWITRRASDGALFATWRHLQNHVVMRASPDGGATWGDVVTVADDTASGPLVVDEANGRLFVPLGYGDMQLARSDDGGATWTTVDVPDSAARGAIFPVAAADAAGNLYAAWAEDVADAVNSNAGLQEGARPVVRLASSRDGGLSWTEPVVLSAEGSTAVFPWIAAGAAGRVVVAWYENVLGTPLGAPGEWHVALAVSVNADADAPEFATVRVTDEPAHVGPVCTSGGGCDVYGGDRSLLDFFEVGIAPDGQPFLAWGADGPAPRSYMRVMAAKGEGGPGLL